MPQSPVVATTGEKWPGRTSRSDRPAAWSTAALVLTALAPLCWIPGGFSRFVLAKLFVTALAVVAAALARPVGALPRPLVLVGIGWAGCFALAALAGDTPLASLVGRWPRYEGLPTLGLYAAACWTGARTVGRGAPASERLGNAIAALALGLAAFSALDAVGLSPLGPGSEARTGAVLGNATDQGAVAMMAVLVLVALVLRPRPGDALGRRLRMLALVAAGATVALSGSRAALVLTLVGVAVIGIGHVRRRRSPSEAGDQVRPAGPRTALVAGGVAVLIAAVAALVPTTRDRLLSLGSAEGRLHQWRLTLDLVADHPLLGLGGSRYLDVFPGYEDAAFVAFTGPQRPADSPHSILLQVVVAGGLVLLAATALALYVVVRRVHAALAEHPEARPVALAVVAYLVLAGANFTTAGPTCLAAFLLGTVVAVPPGTARQRRAPAPAVAVAGTAMAVVLLGAIAGDVALQRGVEEADLHSAANAEAGFAQASRWRPWDVDTHVIAARVLAAEAAAGDLGAAGAAEDHAREALAGLSESYESLVALGVSLSAQGRLEESLRVLDRAVAAAPERPDGYVQRAIAQVGLGQVDDALVDLLRAREILPRSDVVRRLTRQVARQVDRQVSEPASP